MMGVLWEIFEFLVDEFLGVNMQKARYLMNVEGVIRDIRYLPDDVIAGLGFYRIADIITATSDSLATLTAYCNNNVASIVIGSIEELLETGYIDTRFGVMDTMIDLIADSLGALLVSIVGYFYCKKRAGADDAFGKIKDQFIEKNPNLFKKEE